MDMKADRVSAFQGIPQSDLDAVALVATDHEGLDVVALNTVGDSPRVVLVLFVLTRLGVLGLFCSDLFNVLRQDVHIPGVEIEPLVQRDLDVDGGDVILPHWGSRGTSATGRRYWFNTWLRCQQVTLAIVLVHRGHAVEQAGVGDQSSFRLPGHLLHEPVVLQLDQCRAIGTARYRIFHNRLAFELLRPWLVTIVDHPHRGMGSVAGPMPLMPLKVGSDNMRGSDQNGGNEERKEEWIEKQVTEG